MSLKFAGNFGETKYPGRAKELREEQKEKKENHEINESPFDYNAIRAAEGRSPIDNDNRYNNVEEENRPASLENKFITSESVVGQTEEDILDSVQENIDREKASLAVIDSYGYVELIGKLFDSAKAKGDEKEINNIIDKVSIFIKEYQMIIKQHSLDEKEEDDNKERGEVAMLFRKVMGEVAYIKEGEIEQVELLGNFKAPRDAALGIDKGEKIYYADGDKTNRGFLSQREADEYIAGKNNRNKKKLTSSGLGGKAKVFNNRTKKFEIWEK